MNLVFIFGPARGPVNAHTTVRAESLGVQRSFRHRSYWEPWRAKLFTSTFVLGTLVFRAFHVIGSSWEPWHYTFLTSPVRLERGIPSPGALGGLGVKAVSVTGPPGGGSRGVKAVSVTGPS